MADRRTIVVPVLLCLLVSCAATEQGTEDVRNRYVRAQQDRDAFMVQMFVEDKLDTHRVNRKLLKQDKYIWRLEEEIGEHGGRD